MHPAKAKPPQQANLKEFHVVTGDFNVQYLLKLNSCQNEIEYNRRMEKQTSKAASYKNLQIFGYKGPNEKIMEEDIISVMKFDSTGRYLALGDRVGRIIIF